ncbi:MAG TPA: hypothetical protein VKW04_02295 [Planctomycetota bacterium]|nr:hypothetical protein [Planctomycetota bacterium]
MAVMVTVEIQGMAVEKYDEVMKELSLSKKTSKWPKGIESHVAGKTSDGMIVVDVWKSEADFVKFRDSKLGPAFGKVGGVPQPKITVVPVHFEWAK